jgi:hypothetical protein
VNSLGVVLEATTVATVDGEHALGSEDAETETETGEEVSITMFFCILVFIDTASVCPITVCCIKIYYRLMLSIKIIIIIYFESDL